MMIYHHAPIPHFLSRHKKFFTFKLFFLFQYYLFYLFIYFHDQKKMEKERRRISECRACFQVSDFNIYIGLLSKQRCT